ncbi:MAG TPA: cytochrome c [Devosia sp.]
MKRRVLAFLCIALLLAGCEQKMTSMPRVDPLDTSELFADGASARSPVPGTVATDDAFDAAVAARPVTVDLALLQRGRDRFDVYCSPCHDYTGHGNGRIVQRGFPAPPDFHSPTLVSAPDAHFYDVITHGYGAMFSYAARVPPADRWAIVAYVRALQYAEAAPAAEVPPRLLSRLQEKGQ